MRNDANTTCDNEKKCKKKTTKDSKNMIKTQIIMKLEHSALTESKADGKV